jgi:phosphoribosylformimino-5-aminoimidazole carboxamide ribotide isomerase
LFILQLFDNRYYPRSCFSKALCHFNYGLHAQAPHNPETSVGVYHTVPLFNIIPVIDLQGGRAVRAVGGHRDNYRPLATPLCPDGDPLRAAAGLLSACSGATLYIADLDAIEGEQPQHRLIQMIGEAFPDIAIWVDGGFAGSDTLDGWPLRNRARPVLGSESLHGASTPINAEHILSLDFQGDRFLGPPALLENPDFWPADIIVMCLHSVGMAHGPDFERLTRVMAAVGHGRRVYAAGGIRNIADLEKLRRTGAAGALIASALHDGAITAAGLRDFMDA